MYAGRDVGFADYVSRACQSSAGDRIAVVMACARAWRAPMTTAGRLGRLPGGLQAWRQVGGVITRSTGRREE
jgi:hypothetical protein